jgi:NAD-dependent deacetylase
MSEETIKKIGHLIRTCKYTIAISGAGVSTPSGIPDFRSPNSGLWETYDPFEVASLNAFRHNPEQVYNWLRPLAKLISHAPPNSAHYGLANLEATGYLQKIITQNVDSLHQKAGSKNVLEVHGSFRTLTCTSCFKRHDSSEFFSIFIQDGELPRCRSCQRILKPDAILFGEQLPAQTWLQAVEACRRCDLLIVIGSSLEVIPVAGLPMHSIESGAHLVILNQQETYMDIRADIILREDVAETIPAVVNEVLDGGS